MLVACEYSGRVREGFARLGHNAMSCDVLDTDVPGRHYRGDVRDVLDGGWDVMVAHPPCRFLAASGAKHLYQLDRSGHTIWHEGQRIPNYTRQNAQAEAVAFVRELLAAPVPFIALENPAGMLSSLFRKPDQYVEPWMFGHPETKKTGLWLKGLPPLVPTNDVSEAMAALPKAQRNRVHYMSPGPDRWKARSTTYQGIADAMAEQWAAHVLDALTGPPAGLVQS